MRVVFLAFLGLLASFAAQAQTPDVIINEYYNESNQEDEWTEIIVVKDNLNLAGWFIGDNNGTTDQWRPKLQFKNIDLWRNLRRGTYIVLQHAANRAACSSGLEDFDKADGYVRVCVRNTTYFDGGDATTMFLNSAGDFLHVVDPNGRHVFGLGHDPDPGQSVRGGAACRTTSNSWTNINNTVNDTRPCGPFAFLEAEVDNARSLAHLDSTLTAFNVNPGFFITSPTDTRFGVVPGTMGHGNSPANIKLMIDLRKPDWVNQTGCVEPINSGNKLTWTAVDDLNPADNTVRYLVLRADQDDMAMPTQGIAYTAGSIIGSGTNRATVLAAALSSQTVTFTDPNPTPNAAYRVVAYRYSPTSGVTTPDRGPAYNLRNYATFGNFNRPEPAVDVPTVACNGDTLTFRVTEPIFETIYEWKFDTARGSKVRILQSGPTTIVVVRNDPARDSVLATLEMSEPLLCNRTLTFRHSVVVRNKPVVTVTAVDTLVVRGADARFIVEVSGTTKENIFSRPVVNIDVPRTEVSIPFLGGDTTLLVWAVNGGLAHCAARDSATVKERIVAAPDSLFYNNIILPLNSEKKVNQTLVITGGVVQSIEIRNRWGKKVLKQNGYANNWRGSSPGTYFFTASLLVPDPTVPIIGFRQVTLKGWVEVQ